MKRKMISKRDMFMIIIGGIVCSIIVVIADTITASIVTYDTSSSHGSYNTVQTAIDDLYSSLYDIETATGSGYALISRATGGLSATLIDGLYRYQGTEESALTNNVPNFICFGTTDKSTCTGDKNTYLYRIIGIDANGQMKLIKREILYGNWSGALAADGTGLNGSMFLTNTTYIPDSSWSNRIALTTWRYLIDNDSTVSTIGARELAATTTNPISNSSDSLKIGLMYLHDYADAYGSTPTYSTESWIDITKNSVGGSGSEWTISRSNNTNPYIAGGGTAGTRNVGYGKHYLRPVFFLTSSQTIASGSGILENPYILQ